MVESAADLAAFLDDFGLPVVWGSITTTGILDSPGALELNGQISSTDFAVRFLTTSLPGIDTDDQLTVAGVKYQVRYVLPVGDGKFSIATLKTDIS